MRSNGAQSAEDVSVPAASIEKALDVLRHLHAHARPCGPSEIGRALELPRSTVHRLLAALGRRGFVEQDERGLYRPGIALVALGLGVLEREPVVAAARPVLEREAEALGETMFLAAARGGRILVLDKVEGPGFLRAAPRVGAEIPAHATAIGKLYLAFAPDEVQVETSAAPFTARTRTGRALAREVARARALGVAENREEWIPGLAGVAAPVRLGGRMVGALSATGPTARMREREHFCARVIAAAQDVSARLEGTRT
jgi:IclR family transcriptional regulator, acetate operon repressor